MSGPSLTRFYREVLRMTESIPAETKNARKIGRKMDLPYQDLDIKIPPHDHDDDGGGGITDVTLTPVLYQVFLNASNVTNGIEPFDSATVGVPTGLGSGGTFPIAVHESGNFEIPVGGVYDVRLRAQVTGPIFPGGGADDDYEVRLEGTDFTVQAFVKLNIRNEAGQAGTFRGFDSRFLRYAAGQQIRIALDSLNGYTYQSLQVQVQLMHWTIDVEEGSSSSPPDSMAFNIGAPGRLTEEGGRSTPITRWPIPTTAIPGRTSKAYSLLSSPTRKAGRVQE